MRSTILQHFPGAPRPWQTAVLQEVEAAWNSADVIVLRAPVGAGKSYLAATVGAWVAAQGGGPTTICTPTTTLQQQYKDTWPDLPTMPLRAQFPSQVAFQTARAVVARAPLRVLNYWRYFANRLYSPVVVWDEAHRVVPMLQDFEAVKIWAAKTPWPDWVRSVPELLVWVSQTPGLEAVKRLLARRPDDFTCEFGADGRGRYLSVKPLTPRRTPPFLWPPHHVRKLVFMSATFSGEDLYDLGLDRRRVVTLDTASPIAPERRRVVFDPVAAMSWTDQARNLPALVSKLRDLAASHAGQRGVVHTTYDTAARLRGAGLGGDPRWVWHTKDNAARVYQGWRAEGGDRVLVACGMTEGIDLPGDLARWQVVTRVPWPSLRDGAVLAKRTARPDWYDWMATREIQQAVGRSTRAPDDWSVTYVLDSRFATLYNRHRDWWPGYLQAALDTQGV